MANDADLAVAQGLVLDWLRLHGLDPSDPDLVDTPRRVAKAWRELLQPGDPAEELSTAFAARGYDQMVQVGPVRFHSLCAHHLLPFHGDAWVGYVPRDRIVGLSKLPRMVRRAAAAATTQEALTHRCLRAIVDALDPLGAMVVLRARHLCMEMRGVREAAALTTTSAVHGVLRDKPEARAEFLALMEASRQDGR